MADPKTVQGQHFSGTIKSYSLFKGYGFITSDAVDGDIFFCHGNLCTEDYDKTTYDCCELEGKECTFSVGMRPNGQAGAQGNRANCHFLSFSFSLVGWLDVC